MCAVPAASTAMPTASPLVEMSTGGLACAAAAGRRTRAATRAARRRTVMRASLGGPSPHDKGQPADPAVLAVGAERGDGDAVAAAGEPAERHRRAAVADLHRPRRAVLDGDAQPDRAAGGDP